MRCLFSCPKGGSEGEKAFKNSLREINRDFKVLGSEIDVQKNKASFDGITWHNAAYCAGLL